MTLYIACIIRVVRVGGWLEGEGVAELDRGIRAGAGPLRLGLSERRSAARLATLRALRAARASIVGASPYIKLLQGD